ncbi:D-inositol-3-phosphate glycosyltransferase [subsurface metagenome]
MFDEDYNGFWGYEDTDFIVKMKENGIKLLPVFSATVQHQWHLVDKKFVEEGKQRNYRMLQEKVEAYKKGVFRKPLTVLMLVDQYEWAWDIASKELLKHLSGYRGVTVSLEDFLKENIDLSEFDLVFAWYWIMRRFEDKKMVGDPRVLDRLNPEKTILCVAGEHIFNEGFDIKVAKKFKYMGANNKKIYCILKRLAPEKEIALLSHGVDLENFNLQSPKTFTVGWVGSTKRRSKRYKLAEEAVKTMPNVRLKVAGHISSNLFIPPNEMPAFYNSLDCLLVTSETESHPLVVYEAMASGVPVITTPVGDIHEFIKQKKNGLVIPLNCSVDHIRNAINTLRTDPILARRLSVNARETVEEKLNGPLIAGQYTEFLDWLFLPPVYNCKLTVSMLVSRDDELLERAVASVVKQGPDEFRAYIDKFTLKDTRKAEKTLRDAGAKIFYQTFDPKNTSYQLHTYDVARNVHRAILEAENKWVCWIDDDDEMIGDRRLILGKYAADDVGLIHGNVIRVFPRPTEGMIKAKIKDLIQPIATVAMDKPRDAKRCVGSGTIYNRDAFQEIYKPIRVYMERNIISASFWDYMIAYWIKRKGWKTVHVPSSLSIQNVNLDHPPERKKLYGQWDKIADDLDNLKEEAFELQN